MKNKSEIGTVVWKSYVNYLLLGTVRETKKKDGWRMLRIEWDLPHADFRVDEWQRANNVGVQ